MRCDEFGEDRSQAVVLGRRVRVLSQRAFGHEHRVADQSSRPHRECGSQPGFEGDSTFQFRSKNVNHFVTVKRRNDISPNLCRKTLSESTPKILKERHRHPGTRQSFDPVSSANPSFKLPRRRDERTHRRDAIHFQFVQRRGQSRKSHKALLGDNRERRFRFEVGRVVSVTCRGLGVAQKQVSTLTEKDIGRRREVGEFDARAPIGDPRSTPSTGGGGTRTLAEKACHPTSIGSSRRRVD